MYNLLKFNNFRGFKDFSLELKPITLIVGKNSVGKTSILEGIYLLHEYSNPQVFLTLQGIFRGVREIGLSPRAIWESFFYNADTTTPLSISINDELSLSLAKNSKFAMSSNTLDAENGSIKMPHINYTDSKANYALSCDFKKREKVFKGNYYIYNGVANSGIANSGIVNSGMGLTGNSQKDEILQNDTSIQYLGPNFVLGERDVVEKFGQLELRNGRKKIIDVLKIVDDSITDITTISVQGVVQLYLTKGKSTKLPFSVVGDGARKLLHVALSIIANPGSIILLDEAENGFHYSLHPKFWEIVATLATQENCQVIATTHSYECIEGALEGIKQVNLPEDKFALVRLDKNDDNIILPKTFTSSMLENAIDSNWEVR
jgi:AAA15 family ATPase/GTPase